MSPEFWFCIGSAGIGLAIALIAIALSQIHDDLAKVLQRWAALDNLGLTPDTRVEILRSEIDELAKEIDPALLRVLDQNQHWRDIRGYRMPGASDPRSTDDAHG